MLEVKVTNPVAVVTIARTVEIPTIPGIVVAAAYAAGDAVGTIFEIQNALRVPFGTTTLHSAILLDRDDEGIATELVLYNDRVVGTADNSAFTISDAELSRVVGNVNFSSSDFYDFGSNRIAVKSALGLIISGGSTTSLWGQLLTRGAPNISAVGSEYGLKLVFLQD